MNYLSERITTDPDILSGKPVVRGLRISVQMILEQLAAGDSKEDLLEAFPFLEGEDIQACLEFAAKLSSNSIQILKTA
jgi:uncharacterized protein (DUF433 family)